MDEDGKLERRADCKRLPDSAGAVYRAVPQNCDARCSLRVQKGFDRLIESGPCGDHGAEPETGYPAPGIQHNACHRLGLRRERRRPDADSA